MIELRPAVGDDAEGIKRVHVQAWREAYVGLIPQHVLDERDRVVSLERWRAVIASEDESVVVAVEEDGRIVGWATFGAGRDADLPHRRELNGLYTLREVQGRGLGRRLLELAVGTDEGAYLWVLKTNAAARGFYAHLGFVADGAEKGFVTTGMVEPIPEIRMVRPPRA